MTSFQDQIYEVIYKHCELEFHDAFVRLEDGMRAKGHHPDLIHRLLKEDDYVWRKTAKVLVAQMYKTLMGLGLELQELTAEEITDHAIKAMKEVYAKHKAKVSN